MRCAVLCINRHQTTVRVCVFPNLLSARALLSHCRFAPRVFVIGPVTFSRYLFGHISQQCFVLIARRASATHSIFCRPDNVDKLCAIRFLWTHMLDSYYYAAAQMSNASARRTHPGARDKTSCLLGFSGEKRINDSSGWRSLAPCFMCARDVSRIIVCRECV